MTRWRHPTVGTWLRQLTFGHVRQLDRVTETALCRTRAVGGGPSDAPMFIDVDSTASRSTVTTSRARPTAPRGCSATSRCSPPWRTLGL
jgi:hypothetical protein